jgi:hypothetical protein
MAMIESRIGLGDTPVYLMQKTLFERSISSKWNPSEGFWSIHLISTLPNNRPIMPLANGDFVG